MTKGVGLVQSEHHYHLIKCSHNDIHFVTENLMSTFLSIVFFKQYCFNSKTPPWIYWWCKASWTFNWWRSRHAKQRYCYRIKCIFCDIHPVSTIIISYFLRVTMSCMVIKCTAQSTLIWLCLPNLCNGCTNQVFLPYQTIIFYWVLSCPNTFLNHLSKVCFCHHLMSVVR